MKISSFIWAAAGFLLTGLGAVGAVLPLLPAFPFLLGAAFCFAKSSQRLHDWFLGTRLYENNLRTYVSHRAMTKRTKVTIMLTVTLTMGIGFAMMGAVPLGRVILLIVWVFHILYFTFRVKTIACQ